ncbi:heterokaryon incompatibility protein-domain-containing protein [Xylariaceae sp. FL1019]|nr:heterokaryon incompatibility protein-domain-containing protein [Xylariaceae sp. FL1019]
MKLLNTSTQQLKEFFGKDRPRYAILSHTWGEEEISYEDVTKPDNDWHNKRGASKVLKFCELAKSKDYEWVWIDACCIDKKSSAELSEAINSMFRWYAESWRCIVYLADVRKGDESNPLSKSRWFTRGWTLQELIAPRYVEFWDKDWTFIADKYQMRDEIASATRIQATMFDHKFTGAPATRYNEIQNFLRETYSTAQIMAWASDRETTREEDVAYCLLGLFNVTMPLLYGEGGREAFLRLQIAIIGRIDDQSILAWIRPAGFVGPETCLAPSPDWFRTSSSVGLSTIAGYRNSTNALSAGRGRSISVTDEGVEAELIVVPTDNTSRIRFAGVLECGLAGHLLSRPFIPLEKGSDTGKMRRWVPYTYIAKPNSQNSITVSFLDGRYPDPDATLDLHEAQLQRILLVPLRPSPESATAYSRKLGLKIGDVLDTDIEKCSVEYNSVWDYAPYRSAGYRLAGIVTLRKPHFPRIIIIWLPHDENEYKIIMLSKQQLQDRGWSDYIITELDKPKIAELSPTFNQLRYALNNGQFCELANKTTTSIVINGPQQRNVKATIKRRSFLGLFVPEITVEVRPLDESNEQGHNTTEPTRLKASIEVETNSSDSSGPWPWLNTDRGSDTSAIPPINKPSDKPETNRRSRISRLLKQQFKFSTRQQKKAMKPAQKAIEITSKAEPVELGFL